MRLRHTIRSVAIGTALVLANVAASLPRFDKVALRDSLDVFAEFMNSPINFLFPLIVIALTCQAIFAEVSNRHLFYAASRGRLGRRLSALFLSAAVGAFLVGALYVLLSAIVAFAVWPALGSPAVDPSVYGLNTQTAEADSLLRFTYSQWLAAGPWAFAAGYSAVVGMAAASISLIACTTAIFFNSVIGAVAVPSLAYLFATIVAAFAGMPSAGILYSIFPFGLTQSDVLMGAMPVLALFAIASIATSAATIQRNRLVGQM